MRALSVASPELATASIDRPLSIVHLCAPAEVGGLERVVQGLSIEGAVRGHQLSVVVVQHPEADLTPFLSELNRSGVETTTVRVKGRRYVAEIREISRLLRKVRPDVLHTHGYRCDILHGWHARRRGLATVSTLHGSSRMGGLSHLFEWIQLRALRRFDGVIAVSKPLERKLLELKITENRLHFVPNAWTPPEDPVGRLGSRDRLGLHNIDGPTLGWVGRLIPVKGCDVFLDSLRYIKDLRWTAVIVGDGPERDSLQQRVEQEGLSRRVRFLGSIPNAARYFAAFDLQVLSSRSEGTPMVLLEAMGARVPIIATSVGGVPDMLQDGEDGWIVTPESPTSLAEALRCALSSPADRSRRAQNAQAKATSIYSREHWMQLHEEVYRAAMDNVTRRVSGKR